MKNSKAAVYALIAKFADDLKAIFLDDLIYAVRERNDTRPLGKDKLTHYASQPKGVKRAPDEIAGLTKQLHVYISKHPGQRIEQIAAGMGTVTKELNLPVKKLIGAKKLSTKGHKRATTYYAKA